MKLETAKCTVCGASLKLSQDKTISECSYCKSQIIVSNALDFNKVEVDKSKDIIKYRDNLKKYIRNNSIEEILRVSNQILDILPKDFLATYFAAYAHQVKGEPNYIYEFYSNILEHTPNELETVVEHINKRSDLRDEDRIIKFLSNANSKAIDEYKNNLKIRIEQEDNYADIERDVFICCSSKNEDVVKDIVTKLEDDGHTCWVYYRNIRQDSKSYLEDIEKAVSKSNVFLLVSSSQAVASKDVNYEISLARNFDKPRVEFKIDTSERNTNIKDFYKGIKWIDGNKSFDDGINNLLVRILELKNQPKKSNQTTTLVTNNANKKSNKLVLILGAGVLALALLVGFSLNNRSQADNSPPIIQLSGSASMSLNQGDIYNEPGAIVLDNIDIGLNSIISGSVNTNVPGTYTVRYNAIDNAGNRAVEKTRTVTVRPSTADTIKPVIRLNGDSTITLEVKSAFTDPLATVSDNKDINVNLITSGVVNSGVVGTYTLRYNAIDNAGNRADEVVRTVRVVDTTRPVVNLIGSSVIRIKVGETYIEPGANVTDNYDDKTRIQQTISGSVNIASVGTYTLTYTARDSSGNVSTPINRLVIVETNSVSSIPALPTTTPPTNTTTITPVNPPTTSTPANPPTTSTPANPPTTYNILYILDSSSSSSYSTSSFNTTQLPLTLPVPTRAGFNFLGWYVSSSFGGNPITQIPIGTNEDKRYFARWTTFHVINYVLNDGILPNNAETTFHAKMLPYNLPIPNRVGYTFAGWFENSNLTGSPVTSIPANTVDNKKYYAKWSLMTIEMALKFNKVTGTIEDYDKNFGSDLVIPKEIDGIAVKIIGREAFKRKDLNSIIIPNSVTHIHASAFEDNYIRNLIIPDSVIGISSRAFFKAGIVSLKIGAGLTSVSPSTFEANLIQDLVIPDNISHVYSNAFNNNPISNLKLGTGLRTIHSGAFTSLYRKLASLTIPSNVTTIYYGAFSGAPLTSITIEGTVNRFNNEWQLIGFPVNLRP
jgi:uncharacterized repeat protein (TIGR02543 family)